MEREADHDIHRPSPPGDDRGGDAGVSVVVLDSEKALAEALAAVLLAQGSVCSAFAASTPADAAAAVNGRQLDVVVVGTDAQDWDALAFLRWVARRRPDVPLIAMSADEDADLVTAALKAGAVSWISKRAGVREMASVLTGAAHGESSVPPALLRQVLRRLAGSPVPTARSSVFVGLTEREREVLEYSVLGLSRTDIAGELGVSVNTVRTHVQHILTKLRVHTTLEAVTLVLRERAAGE